MSKTHTGIVADIKPVTVFLGLWRDYRAFSNDSLIMMYESIRGALASDDAKKAAGGKPLVFAQLLRRPYNGSLP